MTMTRMEKAAAKAVATTAAAGVPALSRVAQLRARMAAAQQTGTEAIEQQHLAVPLLRIAQPLSPQLDSSHGSYIPGLVAGQLFETVGGKVHPDGALVVPVRFWAESVVWRPQALGGGIVERQPLEYALSFPRDERGKILRPDGMEVVQTYAWHAVLLDDDGQVPMGHVIIPFSGTAIKECRGWNSTIRDATVEDGNERVQACAWDYSYLVASKQRSNAKGRWFVPAIVRDQQVTDEALWMAAAALHASTADLDVSASMAAMVAAEAETGGDSDGTIDASAEELGHD